MTNHKVILSLMLSNGSVYTTIPIRKIIPLSFAPVANMRIKIDGRSYLVEEVTYIVKIDMFEAKLKNDERLGLHLYDKTIDDLANEYIENGWERIR